MMYNHKLKSRLFTSINQRRTKMKKTLLATLLMGLAILFCNNIMAQTWADVIAEEKGDTAVVKGVIASAGVINTLWIAVKGDTLADGSRANPNRIYETIP